MNLLSLVSAAATLLFSLAVIVMAPRLHASYKAVIDADPKDVQEKTEAHIKRTRRYMASFFLAIVSFVVVLVSAFLTKMGMPYYLEATIAGVSLVGGFVTMLVYSGKDADARDERERNRPKWEPNRAERRALAARSRKRRRNR